MNPKYKVSEIFYSPQGEGRYTGQLTAWVRYFSCNLQCQGFSQDHPTKPETWVEEYKTLDLTNIKRIEDLPVLKYGCDTSYSWSSRYKHLCPSLTADEIAAQIIEKIPGGTFLQPRASNDIHLAFTGGEPLLPKGQEMIVDVFNSLNVNNTNVLGFDYPNRPSNITIETNGTQELSQKFIDWMWYWRSVTNVFFSISPKLWNVAGEPASKALNIEAIKNLKDLPLAGQLKFVLNNKPEAWEELEERIDIYHKAGIFWPIWIMPLGATLEQQESDDTVEIVKKAMDRGYNISSRVHINLFGNKVGT